MTGAQIEREKMKNRNSSRHKTLLSREDMKFFKALLAGLSISRPHIRDAMAFALDFPESSEEAS